ncbi:Protein of unknown function (DUF3263) [Micromonospora viridifaciens]|uniref:DUF3263 domain-containing protein n=1 Tax=Micromonospora viridifaciens TaxID=1881 RepID=A0A1C4USR4_MICVI|nr:DUF3263 domain-containing protein [Micromonospora viridifaciens]SCE74720.1 Protein of unknown function (DUF3263) [Micromonospora viridifaciens]
MPADDSGAATGRPDPSGHTDVARREAGVTVPPPRSAPAVEAAPAPAAEAPRTDGGPGPADGLSERDRRILAFEQQWWRHAGAKEQAIRDTFGLSATRYYQLLNALLDHPAALAAEPVLIGRLRRLRSARARTRRR